LIKWDIQHCCAKSLCYVSKNHRKGGEHGVGLLKPGTLSEASDFGVARVLLTCCETLEELPYPLKIPVYEMNSFVLHIDEYFLRLTSASFYTQHNY